MTAQLELDLEFKTSYIFDLLDLLHASAKHGSKLSYRAKDANFPRYKALMDQVLDLSGYAFKLGLIGGRSFSLIHSSINSSNSLFWSV